jgi:hypothetical protein
VNEFYPDNYEVVHNLSQVKQMLASQANGKEAA